MKREVCPEVPARRGPSEWLLPVVIGLSAAGVGVTGTLLWVQSRPAPSTYAPVAPAPGASSEAPSSTSNHEPPASLTAGMPPAQAALALGNWHYDHKAWPRAIEFYRRAIAAGADNPDVRTDLGNALRFSGEPEKALEQYRLAQKQNPRHENSLFNQGAVYASELGQVEKGIAAWRKYLQAFPQGQSAASARQLISEAEAHLKSHAKGRCERG